MASPPSIAFLTQLHAVGIITTLQFSQATTQVDTEVRKATAIHEQPLSNKITVRIPGNVTIEDSLQRYSHYKAVHRVLNIPELLEHILRCVGDGDLRIAVPSVCKAFRDAIADSVHLQRKLMFAPDRSCDKVWFTPSPVYELLNTEVVDRREMEGWEAVKSSARDEVGDSDEDDDDDNNYDCISDAAESASAEISQRAWENENVALHISIDDLARLGSSAMPAHSSLRRMFICQPPVLKLTGRLFTRDHGEWGERWHKRLPLPTVQNATGVTHGDLSDAIEVVVEKYRKISGYVGSLDTWPENLTFEIRGWWTI